MRTMPKKMTDTEVLRAVVCCLTLIMLICLLVLVIGHLNTSEDPVSRPNYQGNEVYSTRWRG